MKVWCRIVGAVTLTANVLVAESVGAALGSPLDGITLEVPKAWPCGELSRGSVKALWLEGELLKGRPTKVFAYVVLPKGASLFDPKLYVPEVKVPLFWFASAGDKAFPFDTLQKTVCLAPDARLAVRVGMLHGHGKVGNSMPELYRFADHVLRGGPDLPTVGAPSVKDGVFTVVCDAKGCPIRRIDFIWCTDAKPVYATKWQTQTYASPADGRFSAPVPANATRVFANFIFGDELKGAYYPDAVISSTAVNL